MHIVAGRQFRHRRFLAKRLQRDLRLQLSRITPSLPWHARLLLLGLDPTLASCPNFGVHLWEQTSWRDTLGAAKALITQKVLAGEEVNLIYTKSWFDSERHLNRLRYQRLIYLDPDDRSYLVKDGTGRGAAYEPRKGDILINIDEKDLDFLGDELSKYDVIYEFDKGLGNGKLFAYR